MRVHSASLRRTYGLRRQPLQTKIRLAWLPWFPHRRGRGKARGAPGNMIAHDPVTPRSHHCHKVSGLMNIQTRQIKNRFASNAMIFAALATLPVLGCGGSDTTTEGSGGSGGNGGAGGTGSTGAGGTGGAMAKEEPNYDLAFPQDRVPRLDITITEASWQAIVSDMTDMLGAFGAGTGQGGGGMGQGGGGMGGGGMVPQELIDACNGLAAGDACSASFMGMQITGSCTDFNGSGLACVPAGGPGSGAGGGPDGGGFGDGVDLLPHTPIYVECDVATEDRKWQHVGIRLKGNSSLASPWQQGIGKMPLRLTFDKFEDTYPETNNQRFYGFKALGLSNGWSDPSLLHDKIGTEVFVNAGIAAPATAFYRVFIDHGDGPIYFGLYTGIELPSDDSFLETHFGNDKGNLYKPDGVGARWETWDAETLGKENHEAEADFSDAQGLFDALHADRSDSAAWHDRMDFALDVDGFLHWLALNTVIQDWDTYGRMPHNYYLYSNPTYDGRFTWIPWDHSFAFSAAMDGLPLDMATVTEEWPLIRYLLDDPQYLEVYRDHVAQAAAMEYEPVSATKRFQAAHDLIAPYVVGPEGEIEGYTFLSSDAAFEGSVTDLVAHVNGRQAAVADYLAQ